MCSMTKRPDDPLTAGSLVTVSWLVGTNTGQYSGFGRARRPCGQRFGPLFCRVCGLGPEVGIDQDAFHGVRAHQGHPVVAFAQLVGDPALAPSGVGLPHRDHFGSNARRRLMVRFRSTTLLAFQRSITPSRKAGFPAIKGADRDVRTAAGLIALPVYFQTSKSRRRC